MNAIVTILVITGCSLIDQNWSLKHLLSILASVTIGLAFMPLAMKLIMESLNHKLVKLLNEGCNEHTPDELIDGARRALLLNPWRATLFTVLLWITAMPPVIAFVFERMSLNISLHNIYSLVLAVLPLLTVMNLVAHDLACRKFVKALFPRGGLEQYQSRYGISVRYRHLISLFLVGPYFVVLTAFVFYRHVADSQTNRESLSSLTTLELYIIALCLCMFAFLAIYLRTSIERPLMRVVDALKDDSYGSAPMIVESADDWAVVAERLNAKKQAAELLTESEKRIRTIIERMPVGLVVVGHNGTVELANPALEQMLSLEKGHLEGRNFLEIVQHDENQTLKFSTWIEEHGSKKKRVVLRSSNNEPIAAEISIEAHAVSDGERHLAVIVDIRERLRMEQLRQEFFAMVSHDLRAPLTALQMTLEMLAQGVYGALNGSGKRRLSYAVSDVQRLINMINQLLEVERLQSGAIELFLERTEIGSLIEESVEALRSLADQRELRLQLNIVTKELAVDRGKITQVLVNLLSNAIKFSPEGAVITLCTKDSGDMVQITITDQGPGIPRSFEDKIFCRFEQVHPDDARVKGGTGLGLAICKAIVEAHGGTIGVDSKEGKGSTFWFRLPTCHEAHQAR